MEKKLDMELIKSVYKPGTIIKLVQMYDDPQPIEPNSIGVVDYVDDAGQIHMKWENGRTLALIPSVDKFIIIK